MVKTDSSMASSFDRGSNFVGSSSAACSPWSSPDGLPGRGFGSLDPLQAQQALMLGMDWGRPGEPQQPLPTRPGAPGGLPRTVVGSSSDPNIWIPMDLERLPTRGAEGEPSSRKEKGSGEEAEARVRLAMIQTIVGKELMPKRDKMIQQLHRVDDCGEAVRRGFIAALQRVQEEAEEKAARLRAVEGDKLWRLKAHADFLSEGVNEVQQVLANVSHLSDIGIGRGQLPMLEALEKSVSNLLNKEMQAEISVSPDDFDEGGEESMDGLAERHLALAKLLAVKDKMIYRLLDERDSLHAELSRAKASSVAGMPRHEQRPKSRIDGRNGSGVPVQLESSASMIGGHGFKSGWRGSPQEAAYGVLRARGPSVAHRSDSVWLRRADSAQQSSPRSVPPRVSTGSKETSHLPG